MTIEVQEKRTRSIRLHQRIKDKEKSFRYILHLQFADEIIILAESLHDLEDSSKGVGLDMNIEKKGKSCILCMYPEVL